MALFRALAVAGLVLMSPSVARANLWDWIQELSGPGSFHGRGNLLGTICRGGLLGAYDEAHPSQIKSIPPSGRFDKRPCLFVDTRRLENHKEATDLDRDNFPAKVQLTAYDFGVTWQFGPARQFEIGTGVGLVAFSSRPDGASTTTSTHRFTITPIRVVMMPLTVVPHLQRNRFARLVKFHVGMLLIPGQIDATDFGVRLGTGPGESSWSARNDKLLSRGFLLDFGELIRR